MVVGDENKTKKFQGEFEIISDFKLLPHAHLPDNPQLSRATPACSLPENRQLSRSTPACSSA